MELEPWYLYAINSLIVGVILLWVGVVAVSNVKKVPGRLQNFMEVVVDGLRGLFKDALGPGGQRHLPLAMTLFLFILLSNIIGQLPFPAFVKLENGSSPIHFFFLSPTANPSTTVGLGVMVFLYVQYIGIRANGFWGYLKHFAGPILFLAPLMFVIEVISEVAKPFSLGMRLFGNIYAEDIINKLASSGGSAWYIPAQLPVYALQLFTDTVQALIFSLLTCAYISLMSAHHEDTGDEFDPTPHSESQEERFLGAMAPQPPGGMPIAVDPAKSEL
jgi:F-type H+-transporting ATPase subunit a